MPTIADRCQRFDFQRPTLEQIAEVLRRVAAAEGIEIEDGAVAMIARAAAGSFRDALGTLDQLVAFGGEEVRLDAVLDLIGAADAELLFEAVDAVVGEDASGALAAVEKMARSGRDPTQFARDLLAHLRQLLIARETGEVPDTFVVTASDGDRLRAQAAAVGAATMIRTIDELAAALTAVREGDEARMAVEIALLKAARPELEGSAEGLARRVERLERRIEGGAPSPPEAAADPEPDKLEAALDGPPEDDSVETGHADQAPIDEDPAEKLDLERVVRLWPAVLDQMRQSGSAMLSALFEGARPVGLDSEESVLRIGFPTSATFNKRKAEAAEQRERFAEALQAIVGERLRPIYVLIDGESQDAESTGGTEVDEEELLRRLKSEFDAEEVS
jgi:DNA polymerase-3 subunit gamma/tau